MQGSTLEAINSYLVELTYVFEKHDFVKSAELIFNRDESGFPFELKPSKSVCACGSGNPGAVGSG